VFDRWLRSGAVTQPVSSERGRSRVRGCRRCGRCARLRLADRGISLL